MAVSHDEKNGLSVWDIVGKIPLWALATAFALLVGLLLWSIFISEIPFQIAGFQFGAVPGAKTKERSYSIGRPLPLATASEMVEASVKASGIPKDLLTVSLSVIEQRPVVVLLMNGSASDNGTISVNGAVDGGGVFAEVDLIRKAGDGRPEKIDGVCFQAIGASLSFPPSSLQFIDMEPPTGKCEYSLRVTMRTTTGSFFFSQGVRLVAWQP